jgi:hypothetical protein
MLLAAAPIRPAQVIETQDKSSFKAAAPAPLMSAFPSTSGAGPSQSGNRGMFGVKTSAPKEPSKLRFSYQPESVPPSPVPQPMETRKGKEKEMTIIDPKEAALRMKVDELPTYAFNIGTASPVTIARYVTARSAAKATPVGTLPTFEFTEPLESTSWTRRGKMDVKPAVPTLAPVAFDWAAAGMKPPTKTGSWACSLCMLDNPDSVVDKCKTCDTPRPDGGKEGKAAVASLAPVFDWAAAGVKPPTTTGTWTCSLCALENPESVVDKCQTCDTLRPNAANSEKSASATLPALAPAPVAFDWAAAGLKPPSKTNVWNCAVCLLDNPESAVEKCEFCDAPR